MQGAKGRRKSSNFEMFNDMVSDLLNNDEEVASKQPKRKPTDSAPVSPSRTFENDFTALPSIDIKDLYPFTILEEGERDSPIAQETEPTSYNASPFIPEEKGEGVGFNSPELLGFGENQFTTSDQKIAPFSLLGAMEPLDEDLKNAYDMAKDQSGCRMLQ